MLVHLSSAEDLPEDPGTMQILSLKVRGGGRGDLSAFPTSSLVMVTPVMAGVWTTLGVASLEQWFSLLASH